MVCLSDDNPIHAYHQSRRRDPQYVVVFGKSMGICCETQNLSKGSNDND